jgi:hypothetical protein
LKAIAMKLERIIEQMLVRYFEKDRHARVYYGAGRPFVQLVQYIDNDDVHRVTELWLDDLAQLVIKEIGARS